MGWALTVVAAATWAIATVPIAHPIVRSGLKYIDALGSFMFGVSFTVLKDGSRSRKIRLPFSAHLMSWETINFCFRQQIRYAFAKYRKGKSKMNQ